jgi:hypothetical protein
MRTDIDEKGHLDRMGFHAVILQRLSSKVAGQTPPCSPDKRKVYLDGIVCRAARNRSTSCAGARRSGADFLPLLAVVNGGGFPGS